MTPLQIITLLEIYSSVSISKQGETVMPYLIDKGFVEYIGVRRFTTKKGGAHVRQLLDTPFPKQV